jgi:hypothetical protein
MLIVDGRAAGPCPVVAGDFDRPGGPVMDDDDVLAGPGPVGQGEELFMGLVGADPALGSTPRSWSDTRR